MGETEAAVVTRARAVCALCKKRRAQKWTGFCSRCLHSENERQPIVARWGPLDGAAIDPPNESGKVLAVIERGGQFVTKTVSLVNCGDLPKKMRHDPAVRGYYCRCRTQNDPREFGFWQVKRLSTAEMRALGYHPGNFSDLFGSASMNGKPGWMLNASDIEDDGGPQDPADDWKRF